MSRTAKLVIVGVVVLVLALGGGYLLFVARTSDSPPPAALDPAPTTASGDATGNSQVDGAATPDGTWRVSDDGRSFVGYRGKLADTDPRMVAFYCAWLRRFFEIDEARLRVRLICTKGLIWPLRSPSGRH